MFIINEVRPNSLYLSFDIITPMFRYIETNGDKLGADFCVFVHRPRTNQASSGLANLPADLKHEVMNPSLI
jgi:hypothetical protein